MRTTVCLVFTCVFAVALVSAQPSGIRVYEVIPEESVLRFSVSKWTAFTVEGRFHDIAGTVTFNHDAPTDTEIIFEAAIASMDTQRDARDKTLQGEDFFDARRYPTMTFASTAIVQEEASTLRVTGDLTIRGVTQEITVPVVLQGFATVPGVGDLSGFSTSFILDRTDFGVLGTRWSKGEHVIGHEVTVNLTVSARHR